MNVAAAPASFKTSADRRYLDLLKKVLTRKFFDESFDRIPTNNKTPLRALRSAGYNFVNSILAPAHMALVHSNRPTGETMIDIERLDNIEHCIRTAVADGIPGDVIETGVWRGGATIFMKAVLEVIGAGDRTVWVADSFQGLPKPNLAKYPADKVDAFWKQSLDVPEAEVKRNFERYGLLDDNVKFLVGFFSDTMPAAPIDKLAVLRLDGDMYESTYVVLEHLYPKLSPGGFCIIDDYFIPACAAAVTDYRKAHGIDEAIVKVDWTEVYWRKPITP